MLTRGLFLLIFVMAAATNFLAGASTARAADVSCSGTLGGDAYHVNRLTSTAMSTFRIRRPAPSTS